MRLADIGADDILKAIELSLSGSPGIVTNIVTKLANAGIAIDASISTSATMNCESIATSDGLNFYAEGQSRNASISNGGY